MELIQNIVTAMKNSDAKALAALFDTDCRFDDSCPTGMFHTETHLVGNAAIDMHFFNRFTFKTYLVTEAQILDAENAVLDVLILGQPAKVHLTIRQVSAEGKAKQVNICAEQ